MDQVRVLEEQKSTVVNDIESEQRKIKDLESERSRQKVRVADAVKVKENLDSTKRATIDDLTRGILNYKYLGLDFEKADEGRLRFSFNQIDPKKPNQRYSFEIGLRNEQWSIENIQPIPVPESIITECENKFNKTDDMTGLVRQMRNAFLLQIQDDNIDKINLR